MTSSILAPPSLFFMPHCKPVYFVFIASGDLGRQRGRLAWRQGLHEYGLDALSFGGSVVIRVFTLVFVPVLNHYHYHKFALALDLVTGQFFVYFSERRARDLCELFGQFSRDRGPAGRADCVTLSFLMQLIAGTALAGVPANAPDDP